MQAEGRRGGLAYGLVAALAVLAVAALAGSLIMSLPRSLAVAPTSGACGAVVGLVAFWMGGRGLIQRLESSVTGWARRHPVARAILPWVALFVLIGNVPRLLLAVVVWFGTGLWVGYVLAMWARSRRRSGTASDRRSTPEEGGPDA